MKKKILQTYIQYIHLLMQFSFFFSSSYRTLTSIAFFLKNIHLTILSNSNLQCIAPFLQLLLNLYIYVQSVYIVQCFIFFICIYLGRIISGLILLLTDSSLLPMNVEDYVEQIQKAFENFMVYYQEDLHRANLSIGKKS